MSFTRRNFLKIGTVSAILTAGNCLGLSQIVRGQSRTKAFAPQLPAEIYGDPLMSYHAEDFRQLIGSKFSLFAEDFAETAVLVAVEENAPIGKRKNKLRTESAESFTLSFRVSNPEAKQENYTVIEKSLGQFALLLVPASNAKGEILLNAVINRL